MREARTHECISERGKTTSSFICFSGTQDAISLGGMRASDARTQSTEPTKRMSQRVSRSMVCVRSVARRVVFHFFLQHRYSLVGRLS
jgi:hypothetical protein